MLNILLLSITSLLTDISSEMIYPILPVYLVAVLGVSPAILGMIEGIAESAASLLKLFSGYFSDKIKSRKPFTIAGYSISAIGKVFFYIANSWGYILFGRIFDRFGKGIRTAPRDALIAENASIGKKGAAFGFHRAMDTLGASIGVLIAYFLVAKYKGDFKVIFLVSLVPALIGVVVLFFIREKKKEIAVAKEKLEFRWKALDKRLKAFLVVTFIFTLGNSSNQFLLLRAKSLGNSIQTVILLYLFYNIIYALVSYPASKLSDKIGRRKLLVLGYIFYGVVYIGFAVNNSVVLFWLLFGIYGLYMGLTEGIEKALITDITPPGLRATTLGLHAALVGVALLPASFLAGLLWKFVGASSPFYFGGILGITAGIGLWFVLKEL